MGCCIGKDSITGRHYMDCIYGVIMGRTALEIPRRYMGSEHLHH